MAVKGWPDYTRITGLVENYDEFSQNYPVGIGDGAARLGSIKTYDMRGRVWWMDDFEASILKWRTDALGTGGSQVLDTAYSRNGNQCVKLVTNTGLLRRSGILRYLSRPRKEIIGIECHVAMAANFGSMIIACEIRDGANRTYPAMIIDEALNEVQYRNEAGGWTDTGFLPCLTGLEDHFHDLKMVFDYKADEWIRVMWDHQELALDREAMDVVPDLTPCHITPAIYAMGDNVNNVNTYVDDVIITIMEPE